MEVQNVEIREALRQAIDEELARDPNVFVLGEEVALYNGPYKVTKGLYDKWGGKRVIDTPISESGFVGLAVGAAMTGLRPIVDFMSFNFSFVACDQIISNAANMYYMSGGRFSVPIVFRGPNGPAAQVSCQHSRTVEALYSHFPGLMVVAPADSYDAKGLLKTAIRSNNPVLFLESELAYSEKSDIPKEEYLLPLGQAHVEEEGTDVTVISYSRMLGICKKACTEAKKLGMSPELINLRTIKPLDIDTIVASIQKTHYCVVVEEGNCFAGISSEVAFQVAKRAFDYLDAPVARVTALEVPLPYSRVLEAACLPNEERILAALRSTCNK